jgi:hypothetical protein
MSNNTVVGEDLYDAYRFHEAKLAELREKLKGTVFYASVTKAKKSKKSKVKHGGVTKKTHGRTKQRKAVAPQESNDC